jgi:hypothetical protein
MGQDAAGKINNTVKNCAGGKVRKRFNRKDWFDC